MESLKRFPSLLILVGWMGWLGYSYFQFQTAPDGQVQMHANQIKEMDASIDALRKKKKDGEEFLRSLNSRREEIRNQAKKLSTYQGALSDVADVPGLIKVLLTEARKLEIRIEKVEPGKKNLKPYYTEQEFQLDIRGGYQQILLFMYRISQMQRILRIGNCALRPSQEVLNHRAVTLATTLSINAYQYTLSKEDTISKELETPVGGKK